MQLKRTFNSAGNFLLWLITVISITALILLCVPKAFGQIVEPKKPVPVKPIPPVIAAKAGQFFYIEAEGDVVSFDFDVKEFPPKTNSIVEAKRLILVTGINGKYVIQVAVVTGKDIKQTRVIATVTGGVDPLPVPIPPDPDQSLASLTKAVIALQATVAKLDAKVMEGFAKLDARVTALEGPRPPPVPPIPPTPTPDADLVKALQAAYAKDAGADKLLMVQRLAAVYKAAAKVTATEPAYRTVQDIDDAVRSSAQGSLGVLAIPYTRDAVGAWLRSQLPTLASTPLDDQLRQRYVAAWTAVASSLEKVR